MRISDWSSDVCSSDLPRAASRAAPTKCCSTPSPRRSSACPKTIAPTRASPSIKSPPDPRKHIMTEAYIIDAVRTPRGIGKPGKGALSPLRSEEHTSELQSLMRNSYAVFCLKKKKTKIHKRNHKCYTHKEE